MSSIFTATAYLGYSTNVMKKCKGFQHALRGEMVIL